MIEVQEINIEMLKKIPGFNIPDKPYEAILLSVVICLLIGQKIHQMGILSRVIPKKKKDRKD